MSGTPNPHARLQFLMCSDYDFASLVSIQTDRETDKHTYTETAFAGYMLLAQPAELKNKIY